MIDKFKFPGRRRPHEKIGTLRGFNVVNRKLGRPEGLFKTPRCAEKC